MIPTTRLFIPLWLLMGIAVGTSLWLQWSILWWSALVIVLVAATIDLGLAFRTRGLSLDRDISGSLSLGVWCEVSVTLHHRGPRQLRLELYDHHPGNVSTQGLPQRLTIRPGEHAVVRYRLCPTRRGELQFQHTQLHILSPMGLWWRNQLLTNISSIRVYPNFAVIAKSLQLSTANQLTLLGIHPFRYRGEGQDFHQLRGYRQGDPLKQIDWKATARIRKLISREYQQERDQDIVFLVDCGWRMLAQDGELSHFDHTLNAMLLLAYVALQQGDAVGFATFSGTQRRFPPAKGLSTVQRILNAIYDIYPSTLSPDYTQASLDLLSWQRKRALIIVLTSLRDEESNELIGALKSLKKRHLVLLACLREQIIDKVLSHEVKSFEEALRLAATYDYLGHRQHALDQVRAHGILSLDVAPNRLSVALGNRYLEIKRSGTL